MALAPESSQSRRMSSLGTISKQIRLVKQGVDGGPHDKLFNRYYDEVARRARKWVQGLCVVDEHDVAASVWRTIFRRMSSGEFTQCKHREDFEKLLAKITFRKAANLRNWVRASKRHPTQRQSNQEILEQQRHQLSNEHRRIAELFYFSGATRQEIADVEGLMPAEVDERLRSIRKWLQKRRYRPQARLAEEVVHEQPNGDEVVERIILAEEIAELKPKYQQVLILLLQGYSTDEIAMQIGRCKETVLRRLRHVRKCWKQESDAEV